MVAKKSRTFDSLLLLSFVIWFFFWGEGGSDFGDFGLNLQSSVNLSLVLTGRVHSSVVVCTDCSTQTLYISRIFGTSTSIFIRMNFESKTTELDRLRLNLLQFWRWRTGSTGSHWPWFIYLCCHHIPHGIPQEDSDTVDGQVLSLDVVGRISEYTSTLSDVIYPLTIRHRMLYLIR